MHHHRHDVLANDARHTPLQPLVTPLGICAQVSLDVLRLDQIHPQISGNKWFKLMPALEQALASGRALLSFGGAWSNHIHALAFAGYRLGVPTIGVIRGEAEYADNAMLTDARRWGMRLHFVSRAEYRLRHSASFHDGLRTRFGDLVLVPEGGSQAAAVNSVAKIWQLPVLQGRSYDWVVLPVGTGGTLAGVLAGAPECVEVLGVPVLRFGDWLEHDIRQLLTEAGASVCCRWSLESHAHAGGYARLVPELAQLIWRMRAAYDLPLDAVYTAKALNALQRRIVRGDVRPHSRILLLHTGGLQGNRGFIDRLGVMASQFVGPLAL